MKLEHESALRDAVAESVGHVIEAFRDFGAAACRVAGEFMKHAVVMEIHLALTRHGKLRRQAIAKARGRNWRAVR